MRFGVCATVDVAPAAKAAGFSYLEVHLVNTLKPEKEEAAFAAELERIRKSELPVETANCLLPGDLFLCGPARNEDRIRRYVEVAMDRAQRAGLRVVVFGSGKARSIPEGTDRAEGWGQLVAFARDILGPAAARNGVTVVVEPLNRAETNVITTIAEGAAFVREVNHPAVRLLVDAYHWARENESPEAIVQAGALIHHAHVATVKNRLAPGLEPQDFADFFGALRRIGYEGRVSVEARFNDISKEGRTVYDFLVASARG